MMKKTILSVIAASMLAISIPAAQQTSAAASFKDVPASHWAKTAIEQAVAKGYFKGYADGTFKPGAQVTRAEFAVLLDRVSTNPATGTAGSFADLSGSWSEAGVKDAAAKGFITSADYPNGFKPSTPLTRKEMAKWMTSGLAAADTDYKQAMSDTAETVIPVAEYFKKTLSKSDYPYVSVALGTGLMSGYADGNFGPAKTTTRAEAAVILMRLADVQKQGADTFTGLKELRAVGTTGTNLNVLTNLNTGVTPFKNVQFKPMKFRNGGGRLTLNYFIVVDTRNWTNKKGIYQSVFVADSDDKGNENEYYRVYEQQTIYPTVKEFSIGNYMNSSLDTLAVGMAIRNDLPKKFGYLTLPTTEAKKVFSKYVGNESGMNVWVSNFISVKNPHETYQASDGSFFGISS